MESNKYKVVVWTKVVLVLTAIICVVGALLPLATVSSSFSSETQDFSTLAEQGGLGATVLAVAAAVTALSIITILAKKKWLNVLTNIISLISSLVIAGIILVVNFGIGLLNSSLASTSIGVGTICLYAGAAAMFVFSIVSMTVKKRA